MENRKLYLDGSDEGKKLCAGVKTGQVVEIYATEAVVTWGIPEDVTGMKQFHIQWKLVNTTSTLINYQFLFAKAKI